MNFLVPQGIGDSVWALHKIQSVAEKHKAKKIEVFLNCSEPTHVQVRALEFVRRFSFVDNVTMLPIDIHPFDSERVDPEGHYVYIPDGPLHYCGEDYFVLMPNGPLERGVRLEDWLPEYDINWDAAKSFRFEKSEEEYAEICSKEMGPYCVFYTGPMSGNFGDGHNRGAIWSPEDWACLGQLCQNELGLTVAVVGADYDAMYYDYWVSSEIERHQQPPWSNFIGRLGIAETFALVKRARFTISYQSGIGIFSSYLGIPTGIFWRSKGNSISPDCYISFEESMASAWTRPDMIASGKHLPLIYGRHGVEYLFEEIRKRGW